MKANELRIGNLVEFEGQEIHINGITKFSIFWGNCNFAPLLTEWFKPIPLTEEWLLRFGFEKSFINDSEIFFYRINVLSHGTITFYFKSFGFNCDLGTTSSYHFGTTHIKHVHQLQNLYFALTNTELVCTSK